MFQRGQKIIILESSAKSGTHPRAGDVGYLRNIYLFPKLRFILLNACFFSYNGDNRNKVEKKKFIIDLKMNRDLRFKISHEGMPIKFFTNNIDSVNLSTTGYLIKEIPIKSEHGITLDFISYPQMHSNYGIWMRTKNKIATNPIENKVVKIPYGQIALFNAKFNHKYSIAECSDVEFMAWLESTIPLLGSALNAICDYSSYYSVKSLQNGYFDLANMMWGAIFNKIIEFSFPFLVAIGDPVSVYAFHDLSNQDRAVKKRIAENVRYLDSLTSMFVQRLDSYALNKHLKVETNKMLLEHFDLINGLSSQDLPFFLYLYSLIRSIFFRAAMMPGNTSIRLKQIMRYLPLEWQNIDWLENKSKILDDIKISADSDSSALNRIYEVIK